MYENDANWQDWVIATILIAGGFLAFWVVWLIAEWIAVLLIFANDYSLPYITQAALEVRVFEHRHWLAILLTVCGLFSFRYWVKKRFAYHRKLNAERELEQFIINFLVERGKL